MAILKWFTRQFHGASFFYQFCCPFEQGSVFGSQKNIVQGSKYSPLNVADETIAIKEVIKATFILNMILF